MGKYIFYFITGGAVVTVVTYLAARSKGLLAAFLANFPVMTAITFLTIYFAAGQRMVVSYAEGLIIMLVPWLAYMFAVIFLTPRAGFIFSLLVGIASYVLIALLIIGLKRF